MQRWVGFLVAVGVSGLTVLALAAAQPPPYRIEEGPQRLIVRGVGKPPSGVTSPAQRRLLAERAAVLDAYGTAVRLISGALRPGVEVAEYSAFLKGARVISLVTRPDGGVEAEVAVPFEGWREPHVEQLFRGIAARGLEAPREGVSREEFVATRQVPAPRPISRKEWTERYRTGNWTPVVQLQPPPTSEPQEGPAPDDRN